MSYFRSYFSKNNTIIKGSSINTARNPCTEIFYGSDFSKFIFALDLTDLKNKVDNGDYVLNTGTTHVLHMTNTIFGDESLNGQKRGSGRDRATSFDLIVFPINEYWDEGVGFDYEKVYDYSSGNETFDFRPSNWTNRTTLDTWTTEGIYSGVTGETLAMVHFDSGSEDLNVDITQYINEIVTGNTDNYGLGVAFNFQYENIATTPDQSVSFFSKYTQTFFEPYLETTFYDAIEDNRDNFIGSVNRNLYLYVTKGTNFYDLNTLPSVDILDSTKTVIPGLENLVPVKIRKGVYKITFQLNGNICDGKKFFYDKWKNIVVSDYYLSDVTQKFIPKPNSALFTIGENQTELDRYSIQFFGVNLNEKIKRGSVRKVVVTFRSINQSIPVLFEEVYYRIYIKEGRTQVMVFDWTILDKTNENSFMLDTSIMIPREYWIEIKGKTHTEEIFYRDEIKFEIVSEK